MAGPLGAWGGRQRVYPHMDMALQAGLMTTPTFTLFFVFPNGRFVPRWTRWVSLLSLAMIPPILWWTRDPFSGATLPLTLGLSAGWMGLLAIGLYAQVHRYRHLSSPAERQQIKWVL